MNILRLNEGERKPFDVDMLPLLIISDIPFVCGWTRISFVGEHYYSQLYREDTSTETDNDEPYEFFRMVVLLYERSLEGRKYIEITKNGEEDEEAVDFLRVFF